MRTGAPLAKAPSTPPVPAPIPISTLPEITACKVSPPPLVYNSSRSSPCLLNIPARRPMSGTPLSQLFGAPTASLSVSADQPSVGKTVAAAIAIRQNIVAKRDIRTSFVGDRALLIGRISFYWANTVLSKLAADSGVRVSQLVVRVQVAATTAEHRRIDVNGIHKNADPRRTGLRPRGRCP